MELANPAINHGGGVACQWLGSYLGSDLEAIAWPESCDHCLLVVEVRLIKGVEIPTTYAIAKPIAIANSRPSAVVS